MVVAGLVLPATAQAPSSSPLDPEAHSRWLHAVEQNAAREGGQPNQAAQAEAQRRQHEFAALLSDFTKSWNKLMGLSSKGEWNAKEARKTRKAFERLVRSGAWIEEPQAGVK
jgi:hypothetical protein